MNALAISSHSLFRATLAFFVLFIALYALTFIDARLLYGVSVWEKPAKFFMSLSLHMATLAWGISLLPKRDANGTGIRLASNLFLAAAVFEVIYISFKASQGEASHFNYSSNFHAMMYAAMGAGSLVLTGTTAYIGFRIFRSGNSPMQFATGVSFMTAAIVTTIVASYLSSSGGHSIGGDPTDATGLPFFHWSTTGGDLRVPHFAALHIMQAVPLITWFWPDKRIAAASLLAWVAVVALLFAQALMGIPLLRV